MKREEGCKEGRQEENDSCGFRQKRKDEEHG